MKITIICVGRIKEKYFSMAIDEYSKRLGKYVKLEIIEVPDKQTPDNNSDAENEMIKLSEGKLILKNIKNGGMIVSLDIKGSNYSSEEFAEFFEKSAIDGYSSIYFIIGGSLGLSKEVLDASHKKISFSKMTFPHQMMRVILLEQIYRGFRINNNEPYHK